MVLSRVFIFTIFASLISVESLASNKMMTNAAILENVPSWLKSVRVRKVTARMQRKLEWTIRRIPVTFYSTQEDFGKAHPLGARAMAVTMSRGDKQSVHLGPKVTDENFDTVFAHELVHVILRQKYKKAIPKWFEEGLANHYSANKKVDYKWLAQQGHPEDVRQIGHPFKLDPKKIHYHYMVSQALAEMLDKKCTLVNLISLSVERSMEPFIKTYCEIKDLNEEYQKWVSKKAKFQRSM